MKNNQWKPSQGQQGQQGQKTPGYNPSQPKEKQGQCNPNQKCNPMKK